MKTLILALKSRTVWTILVMFLIGGLNAINPFIPVYAVPYVQGFLALLATYFKMYPSQNYN